MQPCLKRLYSWISHPCYMINFGKCLQRETINEANNICVFFPNPFLISCVLSLDIPINLQARRIGSQQGASYFWIILAESTYHSLQWGNQHQLCRVQLSPQQHKNVGYRFQAIKTSNLLPSSSRLSWQYAKQLVGTIANMWEISSSLSAPFEIDL